MKKPIVLIIRDGWGINPDARYNAVAHAHTPHIDSFLNRYPHTVLEAAGTAVGLPPGYQGSSEVGHLNMGAGRIVKQEITRVNESIEDKSLFASACLQRALSNCRSKGSALHLMGLVQDAGVHAHQDHLFAIMSYAKERGIQKIYIHFFSDGRDTAPRSALEFLRALRAKIVEYQVGEIATLMGRYYAMDRGKNWHLTSQAYNALTRGVGIRVSSAEEAVKRAYTEDRTPDGGQMTDEYIPPSIISTFSGIRDGDSVIHFNYRQDRAIQLTMAFVEDDYPGERWKKLDVVYCGLTRYYDTFPFYMMEPISEGVGMHKILGEVLSEEGLRQLRIAETQKFRHVTSFFNGKRIEPYPHEDQIEIKSMYDPALFAEHPEMNAFDVTEEVIRRIESGRYHVIVLNYANCDMVGHTGDYEAAKIAVEVVDECVGAVVERILEQDGIALVTADHGNVEEMRDCQTGLPKTSHTTNPVEFIYVANAYREITLRPRGILSDIAPTVLFLLGIPQPEEMTSANLIVT
ncbi:MAG: 2,3-bisphosphoglycerate-independent phosphoglycerate mutase [Methanophagales archaeon ANME-1-THS]|nr:MAG: 2,3-bisphosphoglycerate-independent phosphoglycerate mutase [Methanophagales archaeon ANME-1-THS]